MKQYIMHVLGAVSQELYFPDMHLTDIIEILILTYLIYHIAMWLINTKAWMLLKGMLVLCAFILVAAIFEMNTILFLASHAIDVLAMAAVVVFQPELRRALEKLGEKNILSSVVPLDKKKESVRFSTETIDGIVRACFEMGKVKTGALIVVERAIKLTEYESTGIRLDCLVSSQVLINLNTIHRSMMVRSLSEETESSQQPVIFLFQTI